MKNKTHKPKPKRISYQFLEISPAFTKLNSMNFTHCAEKNTGTLIH